jgi:hypothetical protein
MGGGILRLDASCLLSPMNLINQTFLFKHTFAALSSINLAFWRFSAKEVIMLHD